LAPTIPNRLFQNHPFLNLRSEYGTGICLHRSVLSKSHLDITPTRFKMLLIWQEPLLNRVLLVFSDIVPSIWDHRTRYWCRQPSHFVKYHITKNLTHYYSWYAYMYLPLYVHPRTSSCLQIDLQNHPQTPLDLPNYQGRSQNRLVTIAPFLCLIVRESSLDLNYQSRMKSPSSSCRHYHSSLWAEHPDPVLYRKSLSPTKSVTDLYLSTIAVASSRLISPVSRSSGPYKVLVSSTRRVASSPCALDVSQLS
jgi:hypothetical protein